MKLQPEDMYNWLLMLDMGESTNEVTVEALKFDKKRMVMNAQWRSIKTGKQFELRGKLDKEDSSKVSFQLHERKQGLTTVKVFDGNIDPLFTHIEGVWYEK